MLHVVVQRAARWRWKQTTAAFLAALLLLPTPVLALSFIGPWQVGFFKSRHAPTPSITARDPNSSETLLTVNMGNVTNTISGSSTVVALRQFNLDSSETFRISRSFVSQLARADLSAQILIDGVLVSNVTETRSSSRLRTFFANAAGQFALGSGRHTVQIIIRYHHRAGGRWRNNLGPHMIAVSGSPFTLVPSVF